MKSRVVIGLLMLVSAAAHGAPPSITLSIDATKTDGEWKGVRYEYHSFRP